MIPKIRLTLVGVTGLVALSPVEATQTPASRPLLFGKTEQLSPNRVQFSWQGRVFAATSYPFNAQVGVTFHAWSTRSGKPIAFWRLSTLSLFALAPQGRRVAVVSKRSIPNEHLRHYQYDVCAVQIRDLYSGQLMQTVLREGSINANVYSLAWSRDGKLLATGSGDGLARVWDIASGRRIATLRVGNYVSHLQFSPDGKRIATVCGSERGGRVMLWNWRQKQRLGVRNFPAYHPDSNLTFSPDGKHLAVGDTNGGQITIVAGGNLQKQQTLPAQVQPNSSIPVPGTAFDETSKLLAFGGGKDIVVRSLTATKPLLHHRLKKPAKSDLVINTPYVLAVQFLPNNQLCWVTVRYRYFTESGNIGFSLPQISHLTLPAPNKPVL